MSKQRELLDFAFNHFFEKLGHVYFLEMPTRTGDKPSYSARVVFSKNAEVFFESQYCYETFEKAKEDAAVVALAALERGVDEKNDPTGTVFLEPTPEKMLGRSLVIQSGAMKTNSGWASPTRFNE